MMFAKKNDNSDTYFMFLNFEFFQAVLDYNSSDSSTSVKQRCNSSVNHLSSGHHHCTQCILHLVPGPCSPFLQVQVEDLHMRGCGVFGQLHKLCCTQ